MGQGANPILRATSQANKYSPSPRAIAASQRQYPSFRSDRYAITSLLCSDNMCSSSFKYSLRDVERRPVIQSSFKYSLRDVGRRPVLCSFKYSLRNVLNAPEFNYLSYINKTRSLYLDSRTGLCVGSSQINKMPDLGHTNF